MSSGIVWTAPVLAHSDRRRLVRQAAARCGANQQLSVQESQSSRRLGEVPVAAERSPAGGFAKDQQSHLAKDASLATSPTPPPHPRALSGGGHFPAIKCFSLWLFISLGEAIGCTSSSATEGVEDFSLDCAKQLVRLLSLACDEQSKPWLSGRAEQWGLDRSLRFAPNITLGIYKQFIQERDHVGPCCPRPRRAPLPSPRPPVPCPPFGSETARRAPSSSALPEETRWAGADPGAATPCGIWAAHRATSS